MTLISILAFIFIACSATSALSPLCGTVCHCRDDAEELSLEVDCSRVYLSIVPPVSDWPINVTHLDLSFNNISALDSELAHGTLKVLDLSHNKIKKVVQNAFGGLQSLKYLNLAYNYIANLEGNGFYGLEHLKSLNLSGNALEKLPLKLFYGFIGLQELSLADNPLVYLEPIHFERMISLRWLDVSQIGAYDLDTKIFRNAGQLEFLDLSSNEFTDVPTNALRSAKSLKHLKLNENPITTLTKTSFTKLETLEVLELSYMAKLEKVEEETFSELINLRVLQMTFNKHLSYINPKAFTGLFKDLRPTLEELDLQGNVLNSLDKSMVPCARLRKFNVQQNPWICDCRLEWFKDCEIQKVYSADLKCFSPSRLADSLIEYVKNDEFKCDYMDTEIAKEEVHHDHVVRSVSLALGVTVLALLSLGIALVFKWRDIKEWHRKHRKGPGAVYYVRARANPREA